MIYVLSGEITLFEGDDETPLTVSDAACFKAGDPVGHCLKNISQDNASYLVIGTRTDTDTVTYPTLNRRLVRQNGNRKWTDANGVPASNPNDAPLD